jgi:hypothetical protein
MSSRRLMLITIGLALVVLALVGWAVQALRFPGRGLGVLSTHLRPESQPTNSPRRRLKWLQQ